MHQSSLPDEPAEPANDAAPAPEALADGVTPEAAPAQPAHPADDERRSWPRRKKLLRVQIVDTLHEGEGFPGWVVDRSMGGLRLEVERVIEPGSVLRVRNSFASATTPWVEVKVQSVQELDDCKYLGCAFVRSPTWEVLMQFG